MKKNRIIVLTDENGLSWVSIGLLEQQAEIYLAKGIQDTLSHLTIFSYHLILIALDQEREVICSIDATVYRRNQPAGVCINPALYGVEI